MGGVDLLRAVASIDRLPVEMVANLTGYLAVPIYLFPKAGLVLEGLDQLVVIDWVWSSGPGGISLVQFDKEDKLVWSVGYLQMVNVNVIKRC